jgi:hypothetical protein
LKLPLKERIRELGNSTDPNKQKLANDVDHMALQAELFSRSRILDSSEATILIEQAIAYVKKVQRRKVKVCLAERLVIDAVMDYVREAKVFGKSSDEYLASWQYSASSFGFISEDRLAEAIYAHAHQNTDWADRVEFLTKFDDV